jgi:hypothetical protein
MKSKNYKNYKMGLLLWSLLLILGIIAMVLRDNMVGIFAIVPTAVLSGACGARLFFDDYFWQAEQYRKIKRGDKEGKTGDKHNEQTKP